MSVTLSERGIALVITLVTVALLSLLGLALALATATERLTSGNYADSLAAVDAADAALALAVRELRGIANWSTVLSGGITSAYVDGTPDGVRSSEGVTVDLSVLTNQLTCGRTTLCSDARVRLSTSERPWGANNPRWRLFLYGPLTNYVLRPDAFPALYVLVWVGDDARELDGDPLTDGGTADAGSEVVRVRADAFAPGGTHRSVEADVVRTNAGIRVQSWRLRTAGIP